MSGSIRVAIVDDHAIVRQGLRTMLLDMSMDVVGEAASGHEAVELARETHPDVMLLDIRMKDCDGLSALPDIKKASPSTQVIILTTYANPAYFSEAIRSGAAGYLLKESEPEDIVDAIQNAAAHSHLFDPALLNMVVSGSHDPVDTGDHAENGQHAEQNGHFNGSSHAMTETQTMTLTDPISDREHDVLALMAKGMSNAAIAAELQVSVTTVKSHVTHILRKLDVNDRTQAVVTAIRHGIV